MLEFEPIDKTNVICVDFSFDADNDGASRLMAQYYIDLVTQHQSIENSRKDNLSWLNYLARNSSNVTYSIKKEEATSSIDFLDSPFSPRWATTHNYRITFYFVLTEENCVYYNLVYR